MVYSVRSEYITTKFLNGLDGSIIKQSLSYLYKGMIRGTNVFVRIFVALYRIEGTYTNIYFGSNLRLYTFIHIIKRKVCITSTLSFRYYILHLIFFLVNIDSKQISKIHKQLCCDGNRAGRAAVRLDVLRTLDDRIVSGSALEALLRMAIVVSLDIQNAFNTVQLQEGIEVMLRRIEFPYIRKIVKSYLGDSFDCAQPPGDRFRNGTDNLGRRPQNPIAKGRDDHCRLRRRYADRGGGSFGGSGAKSD